MNKTVELEVVMEAVAEGGHIALATQSFDNICSHTLLFLIVA